VLRFASVSKRVLVQNFSYEHEVGFHENEPGGERILKYEDSLSRRGKWQLGNGQLTI